MRILQRRRPRPAFAINGFDEQACKACSSKPDHFCTSSLISCIRKKGKPYLCLQIAFADFRRI